MGRPPINEHGTRAMYAKGCKCGPCCRAAAEYSRAYRIGRSAPTALAAVPVMASAAQPGRNELATAQEIKAIPTSGSHPGLCEQALTLARDLDNEGLAGTHSSLSRELRSVLEALGSGQRPGGGKLAAVVAMANRPRSPAG
jgi:hypothetical protein